MNTRETRLASSADSPNKNVRISTARNLMRVGAVLLLVGLVASVYYSASSASSVEARRSPKVTKPSAPQSSTRHRSSSVTKLAAAPGTLAFLDPPMVEMITTYDSTCTTPQDSFNLGDTVCAKVTGAALPVNGVAQTRIGWVSPYGSLTQGASITTDPQTGFYVIPTSQTQTFTDAGGGTVTVDNRGTWHIFISSAADGSLRQSTPFVVHDPATPYVDLYANQDSSGDASGVAAGSSSTFHIFVGNIGPDAAQTVVVTDDVPANTTLVAIVQSSGPTFSCSGPAAGGTGTITCTIASLAAGDSAAFDLAYNVNAGTPAGTIISNTATISSSTSELRPDDNSSTTTVSVVAASGGGTNTCTVACPDDIIAEANTTQGGQDGAVVHFSPPSGNDECGAIVVNHCNDCFFPVGITTVTATSATTDTCSFTVTVNPPNSGNATIVCPANQTADANNDCEAIVTVGNPVASGNNVIVVGVRSDGKSLYNCDCFPNSPNQTDDACNIYGGCTRRSPDLAFSAGTTTITWTAITHDTPGPYQTPADEEAHRTGSASCTQTITVNDVTPPVISATNSSVSADANCQAAVPDYSNDVTDNCSCAANDNSQDCVGQHRISTTQSIAAGTMVGPGSYTIHLTANDGSSNNGGAGNTSTKDVTFTVNDTTAPTINCPANITTNTDPGTCSATVNPGTATATDNCDTNPTITGTRSDSQPLNAPYPKGTTTITWRATDHASPANQSSCQQTVTVQDHEPPTISCPSSFTLEPTCPSGAVGNYTPPVGSDNCAGATTNLTAGGASGSVFPIGTTTVTYTVTDASGNSASCSFTVTVKTVAQTIADLRASVNSSSLSGTQKQGLIAKLDAATDALAQGHTNTACQKLADFINSTQNYIDHGNISAAPGNAWISTASHIRNTLGCTNNPCS